MEELQKALGNIPEPFLQLLHSVPKNKQGRQEIYRKMFFVAKQHGLTKPGLPVGFPEEVLMAVRECCGGGGSTEPKQVSTLLTSLPFFFITNTI